MVVMITLRGTAACCPGTIGIVRARLGCRRDGTRSVPPAGKRENAFREPIPPRPALKISLGPSGWRKGRALEGFQHLGRRCGGKKQQRSEQRDAPVWALEWESVKAPEKRRSANDASSWTVHAIPPKKGRDFIPVMPYGQGLSSPCRATEKCSCEVFRRRPRSATMAPCHSTEPA